MQFELGGTGWPAQEYPLPAPRPYTDLLERLFLHKLKCHSVGGGTSAAAFHVRASAVQRSTVNHARDANLRKVARTAAPRANEWKSLYGALDYQLRQRRPNSARSRGVFAREGK
jgi:hypothetical protein